MRLNRCDILEWPHQTSLPISVYYKPLLAYSISVSMGIYLGDLSVIFVTGSSMVSVSIEYHYTDCDGNVKGVWPYGVQHCLRLSLQQPPRRVELSYLSKPPALWWNAVKLFGCCWFRVMCGSVEDWFYSWLPAMVINHSRYALITL